MSDGQLHLSKDFKDNNSFTTSDQKPECVKLMDSLHDKSAIISNSSQENIKLLKCNQYTTKSTKMFLQLCCAGAAAMTQICIGTVHSWTGASLTKLEKDFEMHALEYALVTSLVSIGSLVGCIAAGQLMDIAGRRKLLLFLAPLLVVGWIIIGTAKYIFVIYIGRFICGFCSGGYMTCASVYTSETSHAKIRGRLVSLLPMALTIGIFLNYVITGYLPWRTSCYIFTIPGGILFIAFLFVPNSPYWLLLKGRKKEAAQSLAKLRGENYDIGPELKEMELKLIESGYKPRYRKLLEPGTRKPLAISLLLATSQQIGGTQLCMMFTSKIFSNANLSFNIQLATIMTGVAQLVGAVISLALIDRVGRRPLAIVSEGMSGISILLLGLYFYFDISDNNKWPGYISVLLLMATVMFYSIGMRGLPTIVSSEIFNTSIRSRANSVCNFYNRGLNIAIVNLFPFYLEEAGIHSVFFTFGSCGLICCLLITIFLPETKGLSLEQLQEKFQLQAVKNKKNNSDTNSDNI